MIFEVRKLVTTKISPIDIDLNTSHLAEGLDKSKSDTRRIVHAAIALFVTFACWSLSNPPGATADEWFHLGSIWCAAGVNGDSCMDKYDSADVGYYLQSNSVSILDKSESIPIHLLSSNA